MVKTQALLTLATLAAVSAFAPPQMPGNVRVLLMPQEDGEWEGCHERHSLGILSPWSSFFFPIAWGLHVSQLALIFL